MCTVIHFKPPRSHRTICLNTPHLFQIYFIWSRVFIRPCHIHPQKIIPVHSNVFINIKLLHKVPFHLLATLIQTPWWTSRLLKPLGQWYVWWCPNEPRHLHGEKEKKKKQKKTTLFISYTEGSGPSSRDQWTVAAWRCWGFEPLTFRNLQKINDETIYFFFGWVFALLVMQELNKSLSRPFFKAFALGSSSS